MGRKTGSGLTDDLAASLKHWEHAAELIRHNQIPAPERAGSSLASNRLDIRYEVEALESAVFFPLKKHLHVLAASKSWLELVRFTGRNAPPSWQRMGLSWN